MMPSRPYGQTASLRSPSMDVAALFRSGVEACLDGRLDAALSRFEEVLSLDPFSADAWFNTAKVLSDLGRSEEALAAYRKAADLDRKDPLALYNLGNILRGMGRPSDAVRVYREALGREPHMAPLLNNLGLVLEETGRVEEALTAYRDAVTCDPQLAEAHTNLGVLLDRLGLFSEAEPVLRQALALRPRSARMLYNLGGMLHRQGRFHEARAAFKAAVQLQAHFPEALVNLASVLQATGERGEAVACLRAAVRQRPDFAEAHYNLALALLQSGAYAEGWQEYEWRLSLPDALHPSSLPSIPRWNGDSLRGRTLLLVTEQGYGDTIQCVRFIPALAAAGARVVLQTRPALIPLLRTLSGLARVVSTGEPAPEADAWCPLFSLPLHLGISELNLPADVPYLSPSVQDHRRWEQRVGRDQDRIHCGLAWSGNPRHNNDRFRSLGGDDLRALLGIPGVVMHSVQAEPVSWAGSVPDEMPPPIDHSAELHTFADAAALMLHMDLIVTVDTAAAHLAGALGRPVWVLLPSQADWRWLTDRDTSPWYPTARLFRQKFRGEWGSVTQVVRAELLRLAASRQSRGKEAV